MNEIEYKKRCDALFQKAKLDRYKNITEEILAAAERNTVVIAGGML